jgi:IS5 family transposase
MPQPGFFELDERFKKLDEKNSLVSLNEFINWETFRTTLDKIRQKERKNNAGRKSFDVVMMFKVLVLQHLYNVSDDQIEYQIRDRYSFCRFLGFTPSDRIPDAKTIGLFREQLVKFDLMKVLFYDFDEPLNHQGYQARKGQIVDASFADVPKQRNTREDNTQIKAGKIPQRFTENPKVGSQKDTDARWTKKNNEVPFGYKDHATIDNAHKLIREDDITSAEVPDSQVFEDILTENTSKMFGPIAPIEAKRMRSHLMTWDIAVMCIKKAKEISHYLIEIKNQTSENLRFERKKGSSLEIGKFAAPALSYAFL